MIHNFNAGPSILPREVMEQASQAVMDYNNSGLSILEIGHRTPVFQAVMDEAIALVKELMGLDDNFEVLFLHGGASTQFMQVPMNLLDEGQTAAYSDTGVWASKALKEAKLFGNVVMAGSSKADGYTCLPALPALPADAQYLHITTNNTIYGTQWQNFDAFYECGLPLVADMSSDILSRPLDFKKFSLIYAGAQKNIGAAGVNLVVVKKDMLGKVSRTIPTILDYRNHIEAGSMLNTPPVFAVYVAMLTLRWLRQQGGASAAELINTRKAAILYDALDTLPIFRGTVAKEARSKMNVCFVMDNPGLEQEFQSFMKENGIYGIKGHRTVGGFRASLYNALPLSSVEYLVALMEDFANRRS